VEGQTIGSYKVLAKLGEGGMGVVYTAQHAMLGQRVAIKVLHPHLSHQAELVNRFFNEARATTAVKHPGIISVFDFGWHDAGAFIVMELLDGETLAARIKRLGMLSEPEVVRLARQVASALSAAHNAGIIHRDLKPDNIFIVRDEEVDGGERAKVLDFGIAKLADSTVKTRVGSVMGTPSYMAPELCRGQPADARIDIYALGCVIFETACGRPPFVGRGMGDLFAMHINQAPPTLRSLQPAASPELETTVARALKKLPDERFASMADMMRALDGGRARAGTPTSGPIPAMGSQPLAVIPGPQPLTPVPQQMMPSQPLAIQQQAQPQSVPAVAPPPRWVVPLLIGLVLLVVVAVIAGTR
jgi:serine/threonine protein kinase